MFAERGGSRSLQQNTRSLPGQGEQSLLLTNSGLLAGDEHASAQHRGKSPRVLPCSQSTANELGSGVPSVPWQSPSDPALQTYQP